MEDKSYLTFFGMLQRDIEGVNDFCAHYNNMLCFIKKKYGTQNLETLQTQEAAQISNITQNLRYYATRVFNKISALKSKFPEINEAFPEFEKAFKEISDEAVPKYETVQEFSVALNKMVVNSMLGNLLMQSSDYMKQYSPSTEENLPELNQL